MSQTINKVSTATQPVEVFSSKKSFRRLGDGLYIFFGLLGPVIFLLAVQSAGFSGTTRTVAIAAFFVASLISDLVGYFFYRLYAAQGLAIGPGGLAFRSNGSPTIQARWDDIVSYSKQAKNIFSDVAGYNVQGFSVDPNSGWRTLPVLKWFFRPLTGQAALPIPTANRYNIQFIPLGAFSDDWLNGGIGDLFRMYCPRLFAPRGRIDEGGELITGQLPVPPTNLSPDLVPPTDADMNIGSSTAFLLATGLIVVVTVIFFLIGFSK